MTLSRRRRNGRYPLRAKAWHAEAAMARTIDGAPTDEGGGRRTRKQDCADGLGDHDPPRQIQGAEAVTSCMRAVISWIGNTNWRGQDDVMQIRSFRGIGKVRLGQRTSSAGFRLRPDPRRASGPAATPAASTGGTRDRTRPRLQHVRKFSPWCHPHVTHAVFTAEN